MNTNKNKKLTQTQEMTALTVDQYRALSVSVERRSAFAALSDSLDDVLAERLDAAVSL
jgi:hypothetical protein